MCERLGHGIDPTNQFYFKYPTRRQWDDRAWNGVPSSSKEGPVKDQSQKPASLKQQTPEPPGH